MADNGSTGAQGTPVLVATGMPVRLVSGNPSPDELSALVAVVVVLATASGGDGNADETDDPSPTGGRSAQSQWNSPGRTVRTARPHGPGGWRAAAFPR